MKLTYISILRSLSILVVVFFHVYQYMYVPAHFPETVQMYHDAYFWINQCVGINVAMPMFTLIAGFLFMIKVNTKNLYLLSRKKQCACCFLSLYLVS